jgi:hypothetical protein
MPIARRLAPRISELIAFEAAARHGSFTRAALELNLTQGAVSRSVDLARATLIHQSTRPSAWADWHEQAGLSNRAAFRGPSCDHVHISNWASVGPNNSLVRPSSATLFCDGV